MRKAFVVCGTAALLALLFAVTGTHADTPTTGGGLTRVQHDTSMAGSGTTAAPLKIRTDCSSTQVLAWDGDSWECTAAASGDIDSVAAGAGLTGGGTTGALTLDVACGAGLTCNANDVTLAMTAQTCGAGAFITSATATGVFGCASPIETGDIESVTAGNGLTGGGTTGAVTLDVACGANLLCNANDVSLNLTGASCSAGSYVSAIGTTGTGTCTAEVGDISSVGATANMGLTGGSTSGAATLGLLSTCTDGQVLKSGSSGTTWSCANDTGGITNSAGANVVMKSDGTNAIASSITDTGSAISTASSLTTTTSLSFIQSGGDVYSYSGNVYLGNGDIGCLYSTNATGTCYLNKNGYAQSTTQFRNLNIQDGKGADVATFTGSTKATALAGALDVAGLATENGGALIGDADSDALTARGVLGFTGADPTVSSGNCTVAGEAQSFTITSNGDMGTCVIALNRTITGNRCVFSAVTSGAASFIATPGAYLSQSTTQVTWTPVSGTIATGNSFNVICTGDLD